ncbi:MAG: nuclear transport factor 2 family protein [Pseudomonadota bacterium]
MNDDPEKIAAAVNQYVFGAARKDYEAISEAFDVPNAQMKLISQKECREIVVTIPIELVWKKIWSTLPDRKQIFADILSLDIRLEKMATVIVNNSDIFLDLLTLYKVNGQWKIVDKLSRPLSGETPVLDLDDILSN